MREECVAPGAWCLLGVRDPPLTLRRSGQGRWATLCRAYGAGFACNFLLRREGLPLKAKVRHPPRLRRFLKFNGATARDRLHTQECLCHIEADETGRPRP